MKSIKIDVSKKGEKVPAGFRGTVEYFNSKATNKKTSKDTNKKPLEDTNKEPSKDTNKKPSKTPSNGDQKDDK
jgi:hypothetical protein